MSSSTSSTARKIIRLPTSSLYALWAPTYDHDANILQLIDDEAFHSTIPQLLRQKSPLRVLDLGCGTGRNTQKLYTLLPTQSTLIALDTSLEMMEQAKAKLAALEQRLVDVEWVVHDLRVEDSTKALEGRKVAMVISTLVLEHIPLVTFFNAVRAVLRTGGLCYMSNMHPEMGAVSRAGLVSAQEASDGGKGAKIQGESYNHGIEDIIKVAKEYSLQLVGKIDERGVASEEDVSRLGERAKKWLGYKVFIGMVFRMI